MPNTQHTKGSWKWIAASNGTSAFIVTEDESSQIAHVASGNVRDVPLIAAAPEMLALLIEVKAQHRRILAGEERAFGLNLSKRIGDAIAKATAQGKE